MDTLRPDGAASGGVVLLRGRIVENLAQLLVVDATYESGHRFAPNVDDHRRNVEHEIPPCCTGHEVEVDVEHLHVGITLSESADPGTQSVAEGAFGPGKIEQNPVPGQDAILDVAYGFCLCHRNIVLSQGAYQQGWPADS